MANSTLTPNSREEQDAYGDPTQSRQSIQKAEQGATDPYASAGIDQAQAFANDPQNAVKQRENIPYENTGQNKNNQRSPLSSPTNPITAINALRKGGPIGLIISIILGGGALFFGSFSLLPVHIYENFLSKYDSGNTSYTLRTNRMLVNKLTKTATDGDCSFTGILCRFSRPSNYMLKQLAASGIEPLDANKQIISKNLLLPNNRPSNYRFTDSSGKTHIVSAADFKTTLNSNADFRAAFHSALRTRLQVFSDSIFKSVATKYGFSKENTTKSATTEAEVNNTIAKEVGADAKSSATDVEGLLKKTAKGETDKLGKSGIGNEVGLLAGGVCLVGDVPGILQRTARAYQMSQLIRIAAIFMTTVSALKAGDATQQQVSALGNSLTMESGGGSALNSYGMRHTLYNDTSPGNDTTYKSFVPGGAVTAALVATVGIGALQFLSGPAKKDICSVAASPVTGAVIDAAACPETACVAPLINAALGTATALSIIVAAPILIDIVSKFIPATVYDAIGKAAFGDITNLLYIDNQTSTAMGGGSALNQFGAAVTTRTQTPSNRQMGGINYGDALASGAANSLGQLANAGGNVPLSIDQAVAYNNQTKAVNIAYAQEDQATYSPFDASKQNTFIGAMFEKLIPLYSQVGSLTSFATSMASLAGTTSSGLLIGNSYAATDPNSSTQYKQCDDPALTSADGSQTAAGPFCNIEYGIPTQYLDMDPQAIVKDLVTGLQIDPNTGEALDSAPLYKITGDIGAALGIPPGNPITNYYTWLQTCTDGASDQANNCQIKDKQTAEYALYTIDHRIQKNIDNEDTTTTNSTTTAQTTTAPDANKQALAKDIIDSGKVTFLDANGSSSSARKKIFSDIASGATNGNDIPCGLNIKVLQAVDEVVKNHKSVEIGDTNSYCTSALQNRQSGSRHIGGNGSAVDFNAVDGLITNGKNITSLALLNELYPLLDHGGTLAKASQVGQNGLYYGVVCRPDGSLSLPGTIQFGDSCSHVHVDWPPTDDPNLKTVPGSNAY